MARRDFGESLAIAKALNRRDREGKKKQPWGAALIASGIVLLIIVGIAIALSVA